MHRRQAAKYGVVADTHVSAERRIIDEDNVVADQAIVRHMGTNHEQTVAARPRYHAAAFGARVHRHVLADHGVRPDDQFGILSVVFEILWRQADRSERINDAVGADLGAALDHRMTRIEGQRDPPAPEELQPGFTQVGKESL